VVYCSVKWMVERDDPVLFTGSSEEMHLTVFTKRLKTKKIDENNSLVIKQIQTTKAQGECQSSWSIGCFDKLDDKITIIYPAISSTMSRLDRDSSDSNQA
jgi:hypothetical protein